MNKTYFCKTLYSSGSGEVVYGEQGENGAVNMCMADGWCDGYDCCCLVFFNVGLVIVAKVGLTLRLIGRVCQKYTVELRPVMLFGIVHKSWVCLLL